MTQKKFIWIATLVVILALAVPWAAFATTWTDPLDGWPGAPSPSSATMKT